MYNQLKNEHNVAQRKTMKIFMLDHKQHNQIKYRRCNLWKSHWKIQRIIKEECFSETVQKKKRKKQQKKTKPDKKCSIIFNCKNCNMESGALVSLGIKNIKIVFFNGSIHMHSKIFFNCSLMIDIPCYDSVLNHCQCVLLFCLLLNGKNFFLICFKSDFKRIDCTFNV